MRVGKGYLSLRLTLALVLLPAVGVVACGTAPASTTAPAASSPAAAGSTAVAIKNFAFGPQTVTVRAGSTVTWTNQDQQPTHHTATADGGAFDTGSLPPGQSGAFTFATPGRYAYHCAIHTYMTGVIVVVP